MTTARRSINAPRAYQNQPEGRVNLYNQSYIGFVKDIADSTFMGRLRVWIPEISPSMANGSVNQDNQDGWITVSYCSPFAGATPVINNTRDGTSAAESQQSYGWWAVPPHIGNEVVVQFINGDPNRGIWIGCLFQQRMNHMVPGLASGPSLQEGDEGIDPPTVEYNKKHEEEALKETPSRPRFDPLHDGLLAQGLYTDPERGPSTTSARRNTSAATSEGNSGSLANASHAYGFITPRGNTIHVDDDPENEFIRMRTRSGAQVLINETVGYIYMISKNGNSWFEISDEGINAFTTRSFNVRAMQGVNLHSEGNTVVNSVGSTNVVGSSGSFQVEGDLDILVPGSFRVTTEGNIDLKANGNLNLQAEGNMSLLSAGTLALQSEGSLGITSSGQIFLNGSKVNSNGGKGPAATPAQEAATPKPESHDDIEVNQEAGYPGMSTGSTVAILPTHEPWSGHPRSETSPDEIPPNAKISSSQLDTPDNVPNPEGANEDEDETLPPPDGDDRNWMYPITGRISSRSGKMRPKAGGGSRPHKGVDIAAPVGTPVFAAKAGVVTDTFIGRNGTRSTRRSGGGGGGSGTGYGTCVVIRHDNGLCTLYAHLSRYTVRVGQRVEQGEVIGYSGSTGIARSAPHLHFEILQGRYMGPWRVVHRYLPKCAREGNQIKGRERT